MGNFQSSEKLLSDKGKKELLDKINDIAGNYSSSLSLEEMTNLFNDEYCSKIEILTKDILDKNLNTIQIEYLAQHQQKGVDVDFTKVEDTTYIKHGDNLKKNQQTRKNRLCEGLAKYFVKIFKIYAAISKTLNPVYSSDQIEDKLDIFSFHNINPENYRVDKDTTHLNTKLNKLDNICDIRIEILKSLYEKKLLGNLEEPPQEPPKEPPQEPPKESPQELKSENLKNDDISNFNKPAPQVGGKEPSFCNFKGKNLNEEYGINELEDLFKDKYNFTKKMYEMSPESEKEYKNTLINMYKAFYNTNDTPGEEIRSFSDIQIKDFSNESLCGNKLSDTDVKFDSSFEESFKKYARHMNSTISKTFGKYDLLLLILKEIFEFQLNMKTQKTTVRLKKNISEIKLNELFSKTRDIISQLYIDCQKDFIEGINIYKSIVFSNLLKRNQIREKNIKNSIDQLL